LSHNNTTYNLLHPLAKQLLLTSETAYFNICLLRKADVGWKK
jgi:hypothetical protein